MRAPWILVALTLAGCASTPPAEQAPRASVEPSADEVAASRATATRIVESPPPLRAALTVEAWRRAAASDEVRRACALGAREEAPTTHAARLLEALARAGPPPLITAAPLASTFERSTGPLETGARTLWLLAQLDAPDAAARFADLRRRAPDDPDVLALEGVIEARAALARLEVAAPALGAPDPRADPFTEALAAPHARAVERGRASAAWVAARLGERLLALALLASGDPAASARAWLDDLAAARAAELVAAWHRGATTAEVRARLAPLLLHAAGPDLVVAQELLRGLDQVEADRADWRPPTWAEWSELGVDERQAAIAGAARAGAFDEAFPADGPPGPTGRPLTTRERLLELGWEGIPTLIELLEAPHPLQEERSRGLDTFVPTLGSVCASLLRARGLGGLWPDPLEKARAWWQQWGSAGPGVWWTEKLREADVNEFVELLPAARLDAPWVVRPTLRAKLEAAPDADERARWLVELLGTPPDVGAFFDLAEVDDRLALVRVGASIPAGYPLRPLIRSSLRRTLRGALAAALAGPRADEAADPDFVAAATAALVSDVAVWRDDPRRRAPLVATALQLGPEATTRLAAAGADLRPDLVAALADPARAPRAVADVAAAGLWARLWVEDGPALERSAAALEALDAALTDALPVTAVEVDPALPEPLRAVAGGWGAASALDGASLARALRAWGAGADGPPGLVLDVARDEQGTTRLRLGPGAAGEPGLVLEVTSGLFERSWSRAARGAPAAAASELFPQLVAPFTAAHARPVTLRVRFWR